MKDSNIENELNENKKLSLENNPQLKEEIEKLIKKKVGFWIFMARLSFIYNLIIFLVIVFSGGYFFAQVWPLLEKLSKTQVGFDNAINQVNDIFSGSPNDKMLEVTPPPSAANDIMNLIQGENSQ